MSIVKEEHKATLRKWHEELQEKRGERASLRRSTTVNDVCLTDELLRQLRRAVRLLNGSVNLDSLAEGVFRWCQESDDLLNHHRRQQRPTEFIRIRWALEYYQAGDADNEQNQ
ncbi:type I-E CRISPR-associated protein Cse2/CasB [Escherichia coli]|nr:type I-E CRISPR-associated protein Cse2/CasB [Escherichia coli]EHX9308234.1 type I-E CRISPR-associated protein Cse2/CasB [Escherichia coli]